MGIYCRSQKAEAVVMAALSVLAFSCTTTKNAVAEAQRLDDETFILPGDEEFVPIDMNIPIDSPISILDDDLFLDVDLEKMTGIGLPAICPRQIVEPETYNDGEYPFPKPSIFSLSRPMFTIQPSLSDKIVIRSYPAHLVTIPGIDEFGDLFLLWNATTISRLATQTTPTSAATGIIIEVPFWQLNYIWACCNATVQIKDGFTNLTLIDAVEGTILYANLTSSTSDFDDDNNGSSLTIHAGFGSNLTLVTGTVDLNIDKNVSNGSSMINNSSYDNLGNIEILVYESHVTLQGYATSIELSPGSTMRIDGPILNTAEGGGDAVLHARDCTPYREIAGLGVCVEDADLEIQINNFEQPLILSDELNVCWQILDDGGRDEIFDAGNSGGSTFLTESSLSFGLFVAIVTMFCAALTEASYC